MENGAAKGESSLPFDREGSIARWGVDIFSLSPDDESRMSPEDLEQLEQRLLEFRAGDRRCWDSEGDRAQIPRAR